MLQIAPFRPLRYDPDRISFISRVIAPPYDIIDQVEADALRQRDPHNAVRLVLGKEPPEGRPATEYGEAAAALAAWRREGILLREQEPSVYVCEQEFTVGDCSYTRRGLLCVMLLEEFSSGRVLPHERTMAGPKADRLRLITSCRALLSPIFGVFSDASGRADAQLRDLPRQQPLYEFCGADDVIYKLWRVGDRGAIGELARMLREERLLIADGHHRYETALQYRRLHRSQAGPPGSAPEDFLLVYCVSARNSGLNIRPSHRLVKAPGRFDRAQFLEALAPEFRVTELPFTGPAGFVKAYERGSDTADWLGAYVAGGHFLVLRPRAADPLADTLPDKSPAWRHLPVTLLHHAVLAPHFGLPADADAPEGHLAFTQNPEHVYWRVESGRYDAGFLLPPVSAGMIEKIALAGERMPPKTTYFYPKIPSGLLFYAFDGAEYLPTLP